jgi:hypothetical protein
MKNNLVKIYDILLIFYKKKLYCIIKNYSGEHCQHQKTYWLKKLTLNKLFWIKGKFIINKKLILLILA